MKKLFYQRSVIIIRIKLTELTSFDFVYIRAAALINNFSQLRRLFEGGAYSSKYDMCHLTGCGFRSLESYTGYSPFHIDHNAPRFKKKLGKPLTQ